MRIQISSNQIIWLLNSFVQIYPMTPCGAGDNLEIKKVCIFAGISQTLSWSWYQSFSKINEIFQIKLSKVHRDLKLSFIYWKLSDKKYWFKYFYSYVKIHSLRRCDSSPNIYRNGESYEHQLLSYSILSFLQIFEQFFTNTLSTGIYFSTGI